MTWEYKILVLPDEIESDGEKPLEKQLNELGSQGWELINIIPQIASNSDTSYGDLDINITCCENVYVSTNVCVFKKSKTMEQ